MHLGVEYIKRYSTGAFAGVGDYEDDSIPQLKSKIAEFENQRVAGINASKECEGYFFADPRKGPCFGGANAIINQAIKNLNAARAVLEEKEEEAKVKAGEDAASKAIVDAAAAEKAKKEAKDTAAAAEKAKADEFSARTAEALEALRAARKRESLSQKLVMEKPKDDVPKWLLPVGIGTAVLLFGLILRR